MSEKNIITLEKKARELGFTSDSMTSEYFMCALQTWLRNNYGISVLVDVAYNNNAHSASTWYEMGPDEKEDPLVRIFPSYEEALLDALFEGLTVLEEKLAKSTT